MMRPLQAALAAFFVAWLTVAASPTNATPHQQTCRTMEQRLARVAEERPDATAHLLGANELARLRDKVPQLRIDQAVGFVRPYDPRVYVVVFRNGCQLGFFELDRDGWAELLDGAET